MPRPYLTPTRPAGHSLRALDCAETRAKVARLAAITLPSRWATAGPKPGFDGGLCTHIRTLAIRT